MRYFRLCAHEQFPPDQLLRQASAVEAPGFDAIGCSDDLQPRWEPGESGQAWVWLGAAGQATGLPLGTGVTPPGPRYHPVLIAQDRGSGIREVPKPGVGRVAAAFR